MIDRIRLLEADYFDLEYVNDEGMRCWLDHEKPIIRQLSPGKELVFRFGVKFYTPHPNLLEEEYTRYLFALQIKRDLVTGTLLCSENTAALLASYIVQAEIGDFIDGEYTSIEYLRPLKLLHEPSDERLVRIMEFHKVHVGLSPSEADYALLDTARKVEFYGVRLHFARDHDGLGLNLAVTHLGILAFQNLIRINTFSWAKIRKLSFKRKRFYIKLHADTYDSIEFIFDSRDECKHFWKNCIEHHTFFRCPVLERTPSKKGRASSSSFRPSAARRANSTIITGSSYPNKRLNYTSMTLRSSSADRRSFTLGNMGASVAQVAEKEPGLKRARSMGVGNYATEELEDDTHASSSGLTAMTTSGYVTMAGSAGSDGRSGDQKAVDESDFPQDTDNEALGDITWINDTYRRMTGDWTGGHAPALNEVTTDDRLSKSATGSPRTSAAASLSRLNTELDAILKAHDQRAGTTNEPESDRLANEVVEYLTSVASGSNYFCTRSFTDEQAEVPTIAATVIATTTTSNSITISTASQQAENAVSATYTTNATAISSAGNASADTITTSDHAHVPTTSSATTTSTVSTEITTPLFAALVSVPSTDSTLLSSLDQNTSSFWGKPAESTTLAINQPDLIQQTDQFAMALKTRHVQPTQHLQTPEESAVTSTVIEQNAGDRALVTLVAAEPTHEPPAQGQSARLQGMAPATGEALFRDFGIRAQEGVFILPTVTQFGLELDMDRQQPTQQSLVQPTLHTGTDQNGDSSTQALAASRTTTAQQQWYPPICSEQTQLSSLKLNSFGRTVANQTVQSLFSPSRTTQSMRRGGGSSYSGDEPQREVTPSSAYSAPTVDTVAGIRSPSGDDSIYGHLYISESGIPDISSHSVPCTSAADANNNLSSYSADDTSRLVTTQAADSVPPTSVDQWSSSGSDSTTGVILRSDLASSLSRIARQNSYNTKPTMESAKSADIQAQILAQRSASRLMSDDMHQPTNREEETNPTDVRPRMLASSTNRLPNLPLDTLPARTQHLKHVQTYTCAHGHRLSRSIPCSVHLSGLIDTVTLSHFHQHHIQQQHQQPHIRRDENEHQPNCLRHLSPQESELEHERSKKIQGQGIRPQINGGSVGDEPDGNAFVLIDREPNNPGAGGTGMEEVPYVVLRRPRSVDVKQYQLHLQRQQQQAAALAAAAAGYPIYPGMHFYRNPSPSYHFTSRLPMMDPQFAYAPCMAPYPVPVPERSDVVRRDRRSAGGMSGQGGSGGGMVKSSRYPESSMMPNSSGFPGWPDAYEQMRAERHGGSRLPDAFEQPIPAQYIEREKRKAKRRHSKSQTEVEKTGDSVHAKSRAKPVAMHPPVPYLAGAPSAPMVHHHLNCIHRQPDILSASQPLSRGGATKPAGVPTGEESQARITKHTHEHQALKESRVTATGGRTTLTSTSPSTKQHAQPREHRDKGRRSNQPESATASAKVHPEQEDNRESEIPYPVSELLFSPSREARSAAGVRQGKVAPPTRHQTHHPACASLMSRARAQNAMAFGGLHEKTTATEDKSSPVAGYVSKAVGRSVHSHEKPNTSVTKQQLAEKTRTCSLEKHSASLKEPSRERSSKQSSSRFKVFSQEEAKKQQQQINKDTRETIEQLKRELKSAGFKLKSDDSLGIFDTSVDMSPDARITSTSQVPKEEKPSKKLPSKQSPKKNLEKDENEVPLSPALAMATRGRTTEVKEDTKDTHESKEEAKKTGIQSKKGGVGSEVHKGELQPESSFGVPPRNPIYLDSDSDSGELLTSPSKSMTEKGSPPVAGLISCESDVQRWLKQSSSKQAERSGTLAEGSVQQHALKADGTVTPDELLTEQGVLLTEGEIEPYVPSPKSHSPSLPLSIHSLRQQDTDLSSASETSSDGSRTSSHVCYLCYGYDWYGSNSGSRTSSCSRHRSHHAHSHHRRHRRYSPDHCRCSYCLARRDHMRRHFSEHRRHDSRRYRHESGSVRRRPDRTHRSFGGYPRYRHDHHHGEKLDFHASSSEQSALSRSVSLSGSPSSHSSGYDGYLKSKTESRKPENLKQIMSANAERDEALSTLLLQEEILKGELEKRRTLTAQLKEIRRRTQQLLALERDENAQEVRSPVSKSLRKPGAGDFKSQRPIMEISETTTTESQQDIQPAIRNKNARTKQRAAKETKPEESSEYSPVKGEEEIKARTSSSHTKLQDKSARLSSKVERPSTKPSKMTREAEGTWPIERRRNKHSVSIVYSKHRGRTRPHQSHSTRARKVAALPSTKKEKSVDAKEGITEEAKETSMSSRAVPEEEEQVQEAIDDQPLVIVNTAALATEEDGTTSVDNYAVNITQPAVVKAYASCSAEPVGVEKEKTAKPIKIAEKAESPSSVKTAGKDILGREASALKATSSIVPMDFKSHNEEYSDELSAIQELNTILDESQMQGIQDVDQAKSGPQIASPSPPPFPPPTTFCVISKDRAAVAESDATPQQDQTGGAATKSEDTEMKDSDIDKAANAFRDYEKFSSINRLTEDTPNDTDDNEYDGTRTMEILGAETATKTASTDAEEADRSSEKMSQDSGEYLDRSLTDSSNRNSNCDDTHTSEASLETVKPADSSRPTSPSNSTTSASEGSEEIEPFPSPPPEPLIDSYVSRSSPLSHRLLSNELDEVIEEETGILEVDESSQPTEETLPPCTAVVRGDASSSTGEKEQHTKETTEDDSTAMAQASELVEQVLTEAISAELKPGEFDPSISGEVPSQALATEEAVQQACLSDLPAVPEESDSTSDGATKTT
ncbi:unnamed protein product [Calicophoron daubneyi]|uniref:FERM domain-containing protein n=1 Tax=Calicophoron daubneyi TaxID=300641 RepID=A0AAV2T1W3_CALDB